MEFSGKVLAVAELRTGTNAQTGQSWASQEYTIEDSSERYPERIVVNAFGMDKIQAYDLHVGDEVRINFGCNAHEYQGKWYNDLRLWRVEKITYQRQQAAPQPQFAPPAPQAVPSQPAPGAVNSATPQPQPTQDGDLPF